MNGTQNTAELKNSNQKALSNTGALIFAYNNDTFDYIKIAEVAAHLVRKHLQIPVALVTDTQIVSAAFDKIIIEQQVGTNSRLFKLPTKTVRVDWKNKGRWGALELSPYERTLLIDADYLVRTDYLKTVLDNSVEFACYKTAYDVMHKGKLDADRTLSTAGLDMWWATVVVFDKHSEKAQLIFYLWQLVAENWEYYSKLYNFKASVFRNDFALSIAVHMATGMCTGASAAIPLGIPTLSSTDTIIRVDADRIVVADDEHRNAVYTDLHVMNKHLFTQDIVEALLDA